MQHNILKHTHTQKLVTGTYVHNNIIVVNSELMEEKLVCKLFFFFKLNNYPVMRFFYELLFIIIQTS